MTTRRPLVRFCGVVHQLPIGDQVVGGPLIGEVRQFAGAAEALQDGWLVCDHAEVSRVDRAALFAVIGTRFGAGDGVSTFNLPNLEGKFVAGATAETGPGGTGGANEVSLAVDNLPEHSHALGASAKLEVVPGAVGVDPFPSVDPYYLTGVTGSANGPTTTTAPGETAATLRGFGGETDAAGTGQPFDNRPAFVELLYIIYAGT